jgi:hypothetical protein
MGIDMMVKIEATEDVERHRIIEMEWDKPIREHRDQVRATEDTIQVDY